MPIQKAELLAFIVDYDKRKGGTRKKLVNRSWGMEALDRQIAELEEHPDVGGVPPHNLVQLFRHHILVLSHWNRNTLTGEIANDMRNHILEKLDVDTVQTNIFLANWEALSLGKGPSEVKFSIGFSKSLLARISALRNRNKSEKEKFRKEFIAMLEYNPKLREAILSSEDNQYADKMQQQAQRAIKDLLDGDPILATLVYKKFKRANKQLFETHRAIWGRRSLTNAEQIFSALKQDEHKAFLDGLLAQPLDPTMELDIVAAEGKLWKAIYHYPITGQDRHLYFQARLTMFDTQGSQRDIKTILGSSRQLLDTPVIPAALATIILHVKSFWKQAKPSWWDHFCNLVGRKSDSIPKLHKNSCLFQIELDSPKDKLYSLWTTFTEALEPQDRSVIAHHLCETLLAETSHANFFSHMTQNNSLPSQQLLAYALTIDRYRLILVQYEGLAADQDLLPHESKLQQAIDLMRTNQEDPFIQDKMKIIGPLLGEQGRSISPRRGSTFSVGHSLGGGGGAGASFDPADELAAGAAGAALPRDYQSGASFHRQPAQSSDNPRAPLLQKPEEPAATARSHRH